MIHTLQLGQAGLWKPRGVDNAAARRNLRMCTVIAHDLHGDLNEDARTGLALSGTASYTTGPAGEANGAVASGSTSVRFLQADPRGINFFLYTQCFFVSVWVRRRVTGQRVVWAMADGTVVSRVTVLWDTAGSGSVELRVPGQTIAISPAPPLDVYEHLVWSFDGTNYKLYRNGSLADTTANTASAALAFTRWALGSGTSTLPADFGMDMSYFVYGHGAIGQTEVTYLYNSGAGRPASDWMTVAYGTDFDTYASSLAIAGDGFWKLNATSGTTATDSVGSGIGNGTLTNGAAYSTAIDPPAGFSTADGVVDLDGTNDHVDLPDINMAAGSLNLTMAAWVYHDTLAVSQRYIQIGISSANNNSSRLLAVDNADAQRTTAGNTTAAGASTGTVDAPVDILTTSTWHFPAYIYETASKGLLLVHNGVMQAGVEQSADPSAVNLTVNSIGSRGGTLPLDGKVSRTIIFRQALILPQIAKLHDLGAGSG